MIPIRHCYPAITAAGLGLALAASLGRADDSPMPEFGPDARAFLESYCLKCHSGEKPKAELSLDSFGDATSIIKARKVWRDVLDMIITGEMPPEKKPQPSPAEAEAFTGLVTSIFEYSDRNAKPDPGRVTMRRLNRVEYRNTIRDLVGVDFDPNADFPSDDIGHGFDNIGDVLSLSPLLMERYLSAADTIMDQAIMPTPPPVIKRHLASTYTEPASANSGKLVVDGFRPMRTDGKEAIELGAINTPYKWEPDGEYLFRTRVFASRPLRVSILVHGQDLPGPSPDSELDKLSGNINRPARILKTFDINATTREQAEVLEVRVPPIPNRHRMIVAIDKPGAGQPPATLWVEYLALDGPLDPRPASHRRLLAADGNRPQADQTREIMKRFLLRAYRRPPEPDELARTIGLVDREITAGQNWESAVQFAMQAALCSPKFLFRVELDSDPQGTAIRDLDEFQLASRLSYFLWSTMPDDTLFELAGQGLLAPNLDAQVARMLADPRASSLVENFAMQWLQLKRIEFISPDGTLFPTFNQGLRDAMLRETELFVGSIFREDRSILELIDADYTFLNEPLARHYGIEGVRGSGFARVSLQDRVRGGLLTHASVLTVTSNPTRTSPVKRGRWVLEQILGKGPPPPPPNVPELPAGAKDVAASSLRERMEEHRRNPACANCHAKMDPIGFALENFDAVGAYRQKDGAFDIDASGELPDGTKFDGPGGLKAIVRKRKEEFVRCLTERMLIYAIGRGLEYYDRPTVETIVSALPGEEYKFSSLVKQIVKSDAFRRRRGSL